MAMYFRDENYYFCSIMKIIMDILKLDQGGWGAAPQKVGKIPPIVIPHCEGLLGWTRNNYH